MLLYHGSEQMIEKPSITLGNAHNDYGKGFYCTENIELAKEWACKNGQNGFANCYEIDEADLKICRLNENYHILNWLAVLTKYRSYWQSKSIAEEAKEYLQKNYYVDLSEYDIVIGYRADDSYFSFAQDFVMGTISLQKLSRAMQLGKLGEQVVLKSEKAFEKIKYVGYETALSEIYYSKKVARDRRARQEYREEKEQRASIEDIYMIDIMRGKVSEDELRI